MSNEQQYDQRFYWGLNNPKALEDQEQSDEGGNPLSTSRGLKSVWISQIKETANSMLSPTDWAVIRQIERQIAIPSHISINRSAIIAECNRLETAISGCSTVEELITVVTTQNWPNERL